MVEATLVTDGSADTVLIRVIEWLIGQLTPAEIEIRWADLRLLRVRPSGLSERLTAAIELFPCQILFVHRDAEAQDPNLRYTEIQNANASGLPHVCVVPVRMQEAWLLLSEEALRQAAGRPSGREPLNLPAVNRWEDLANPKAVLHAALKAASGTTGRRARNFRPDRAAHRLAELVTDWSPLRRLTAFQRLEADTRASLNQLGLL
jgi:hypothetical protein